MLFKHIIKPLQRSNIRFYVNCAVANLKILSEGLEISTEAAEKIQQNYTSLLTRNPEVLSDSIAQCKRLGYTNEEIAKYSVILTYTNYQIIRHLKTLEEGGFYLDIKGVAKYRPVRAKTVSYLKQNKYVKSDICVPTEFIKFINHDEFQWDLRGFSSDCKWNDIQFRIKRQYLEQRLYIPHDKVLELLRRYPSVGTTAFRIMEENIKFVESLGMTIEKITRFPYVLNAYPECYTTVLKDLDNMAGINWRAAMFNSPKLMCISPKQIVKIYGTIKEFDIPDQYIATCPKIFGLSPETIRLRLQDVESSDELKFLLRHPRLLLLIYHHTKARSRLPFLTDLRCSLMSMLVHKAPDMETFHKVLAKRKKDINSYESIIKFVKTKCEIEDKYIRDQLKVHPFSLHIPIHEMEDTLTYLNSQHYHTRQILRVLHVLLYSKESLETAMNEMNSRPELNADKLKPVQKLQLMIYLIEKKFNFTGEGVWRGKVLPDDGDSETPKYVLE